MATGIFQSSAIPVLEQVVNFSQARHNLLAGNIANMDTPDYKARDLSPEMFQSDLKRAIETGSVEHDLFGTAAAGQSYQKTNTLFHDGSNDSLEHQVTEVTKNQMQHNLALSILTSQFRLLQAAISERA